MPLPVQTDIKRIEHVLDLVLNTQQPPVGRCRLLSSGFGHSHTFKDVPELAGFKGCIGCGNCIDVCPVLAREPSRRIRTEQRTSFALEALVAELLRTATAVQTASWPAPRWIPPSSIMR
jgi:ferredoxin